MFEVAYVFLDSNVQALMLSNKRPTDHDYWWVVPIDTDINQIYINKQGSIAYYPPKPAEWAVFDVNTETWIDPRTQETIHEALHLKRTKAFLPKLEFILKVVDRNYISPESGLLLLEGKMPTEIEGLSALLNARQLFEFQAKMIAASQVDRMDPFIQLVAWYMQMNDEEVDDLFGINVEEL